MARQPGSKFVFDQPIYDTVQLTAVATQTLNFFSVPLGGALTAAIVKNFTHTNMTQSGTLERGTTMRITGYSLFLRELAAGGAAPTLADARAVSNGNVIFSLGRVSYYTVASAMIPNGGAELYLNDTATVHVGRGLSTWQNRIHLANPIDIDEQELIGVQIQLNTAIAAVTDVAFVLWGTQWRPVR